MKFIIILLSPLYMSVIAYGQRIIIVNEVKCTDVACTLAAGCSESNLVENFSNYSNPFDCKDTPCYTDCKNFPPTLPCFSKVNLAESPSNSWLIFEDTEVGLNQLKKIKVLHYFFQEGVYSTPLTNIRFASASPHFEIFRIKADGTTESIHNTTASIDGFRADTDDEFWVRFRPESAGIFEVNVEVSNNFNSDTPCISSFKGYGKGLLPQNKDFVLALDKSGSMNSPAYGGVTGPSKMDELKKAARMFIDLGREGDKFGAVSYSNSVDSRDLIGKSTLDPNPHQSWIEDLTAGGTTAIGKAVQKSMELLGANVGACEPGGLLSEEYNATGKVIVLLTDGIENVAPYIDQNRSPRLPSDCFKQAYIYTIGFGTPGQFSESALAMLPYYSKVGSSDGYYHVQDGDIENPFGLQEAYFKIYSAATNIQNVVDPTIWVDLAQSGERTVHTALITTSDVSATFAVFEKIWKEMPYELKLISPSGQVITPGAMTSGLNSVIITGSSHTIFKVDFKNVSDPAQYSGTWLLKLVPKSGLDTTQRNETSRVPIGFAVAAFSNLRMETNTISNTLTPGSEIIFAVSSEESGLPIDKADYQVTITTPRGKEYPLKLEKDIYGKLTGRFPHTYEAGSYQIFTRAYITNMAGEKTTREDTRFVVLSYPQSPEVSSACISCGYIKIIIVIGVLLLLLLVYLIYRRRLQA